jgi:hypothetical protein
LFGEEKLSVSQGVFENSMLQSREELVQFVVLGRAVSVLFGGPTLWGSIIKIKSRALP